MNTRILSLVLVTPIVLATACGDDINDDNTVTGTTNTATVRFVNATGNSNLSVANNGVVATGNGNLAFGAGSSCMVVNTTSPNLTFTNATTGATISGFTPVFTSGGNNTVVAFTDANGNTQFATLDNTFTPTSGSAGLRIFNAANGSGSVVVNGNGTALGTGSGVAFGTNGSFFSVPAGTQTITFNTGTGTNTIANVGSMTFTAGQNQTLILAPAATGSTTLRTFTTNGC
jgi:hypothetical protein